MTIAGEEHVRELGAADGRSSDVCVLVPVTPPEYPLHELYIEFERALDAAGLRAEFVFLLEDRNVGRIDALRALRSDGAAIRILMTGDAPPEGALAQIAARHTDARVVVTLPSFPVVAPEALPQMIRALDAGPDVVAAARDNRDDPLVNRIQRGAFHFLLQGMVGGQFSDIANGVRAMRRGVLEQMDLYGDFNRFLPMLALRDGFQVEEVRVRAHEGDRRTRVYNPGVYIRRVVDLIGLMFLVRFTYKPLRFFGLVGMSFMTVGSVVLGVLAVQRLGGRGIADRPLLLLGVLLVVVGIQAMGLGLVGEIVVHHNISRRPLYRLREASPRSSDERVSDGDPGHRGAETS